VVAAAIDGDTGEVFRKRLTPGNDDVIGWVRSLPGPSAVVCEAGALGSAWPGHVRPQGSGARFLPRRRPSVRLVTRSRPRCPAPVQAPAPGWDRPGDGAVGRAGGGS